MGTTNNKRQEKQKERIYDTKFCRGAYMKNVRRRRDRNLRVHLVFQPEGKELFIVVGGLLALHFFSFFSFNSICLLAYPEQSQLLTMKCSAIHTLCPNAHDPMPS